MVQVQQLPVPPAVFVDRVPVLEWMTARLDAARAAGRPAFLALHGPPGVGLRSMVHKCFWDAPERFADGSVRVRLGDGVAGTPDPVGEALGDLLVDLGVPAGDLPVSEEARARRLKTVTYRMSVLVVLEEVSSAAQVERFLVNSPTSAVVALCRSPLAQLRRLGFELAPVEPLEDRFGVELFEQALGPSWYSAAGVTPESVVRACGGYPLAITTTAAQIAGAREWEVADLVRDVSRRGLSALDRDAQEYVRDSFDRAYNRVAPAAARVYRLVVGLHPGRSVTTEAAATTVGTDAAEVRAALVELAGAQLVTQVAADRFEFHDVAYWHARESADIGEARADQRAAVARIVGWYLAAAVRHDRVLSARPRSGPLYQEPPPLQDGASIGPSRAEALAWLESHRQTLSAAVLLAHRFELHDLVWQLCEAMWGVLHLHGHYDDWIATHRAGVDSAMQVAEPAARMRVWSQLGSALLAVGDLDEAGRCFVQAYRFAPDPVGQQSALEWSGKVAARRGDWDEALSWYDRSWQVAAEEVAEKWRPRMLALLWLQRARAHRGAGRADAAVAAASEALRYFAGTAESDNLAKSLYELAEAQRLAGAPDASDNARRAAELFRADDSPRGEASALATVIECGAAAEADQARVLELYLRLGDPRGLSSPG
ncbi:hypothetical protein [Actinokineospora diospyrosa]|uniref:Tetratricopeptide repeat-containing protein n=1 Tax=Actinokineospora diospyrosa TaxID=103728 RepID=A0ABT1IBN6_9PSEU|nr:hypothetical protein [Actinokineospora diospyrosa]MCP2270054.1 Tetratricopeptide repeat-containing protein [Actinokineospora diospyrosa]